MNSNVKELLSVLSEDEKTLLKDTIRFGGWGDCEMVFRDEAGNIETVYCYGYCTNDAHLGGHFSGRKVSSMFRSIYKKLCPDKCIGRFVSHCSDWWGDGSGDMLFIRTGVYQEMDELSRNA